jgi:hypothetical protein
MGGSNWRPGTEIHKLIREIEDARSKDTEVTFTLRLTITSNELRALIKYVDQHITDRFKQEYLYETEEERALLDAMEALAAALPGPPP